MATELMERLTIHVLTLFPDIIDQYCRCGIVRRAIENGLVRINTMNIRDFADDRHGTVDDTPYGGGAGMIMKADVLARSLKSVTREGEKSPVVLLTPQGKTLTQPLANEMSLWGEFTLVCGRYRGVDERFRERYVTEELSIGDYVLSGGEPAAVVVIDAVARLVPGVMQDFESGCEDSFQNDLLDCPWYTRPLEFEGLTVPEVLLSGNHANIREWRQNQAEKRTRERRPELLRKWEK
ncbi:tRNA (guanosine(37)-N1)-methyltransferase TrmD [Candidatus Latescibacterota bacterium]